MEDEDASLSGEQSGVDPDEMTSKQINDVIVGYEGKMRDFEQKIIKLERDFERFDPESDPPKSDPLVKNPAFIVFSNRVNSLSDEMKNLKGYYQRLSSKELGDTVKLQGEINDLRSKQNELESKMEGRLESVAESELISKFQRALLDEYGRRLRDLEQSSNIFSRLSRMSNMCPGEQCGAPLTRHSKSEWDTFLSEKEEEIREKLYSMDFALPRDTDIKSGLISTLENAGINDMVDIKDTKLIEGIISDYIENLTAVFTTQGEDSAITEKSGGGKRKKKYSKKKKKSKKKKGKSKRKRSKTRRR
tara:strand:+ start:133 stop:1044 length:912 start_codon:yes stop_codon:yes gene_type:complete